MDTPAEPWILSSAYVMERLTQTGKYIKMMITFLAHIITKSYFPRKWLILELKSKLKLLLKLNNVSYYFVFPPKIDISAIF